MILVVDSLSFTLPLTINASSLLLDSLDAEIVQRH